MQGTLDNFCKKYSDLSGDIKDVKDEIKQAVDDVFSSGIPDLSKIDIPKLKGRLVKANESLEEYDAKLEKHKNELDAASREISQNQRDLRIAKNEIDEGTTKLREAYSEIISKRQELSEGEEEYNSSLEEYTQKESEYNSAVEELDQKKAALLNGKKEIAKRNKELESGIAQLNEARNELEKIVDIYEQNQISANKYVANMSTIDADVKQAILTRYSLIYLNTIRIIIGMLQSLRYSMALLFFAVGLFVCYAAITRMVHAQCVDIGMKKSLGFFDGEITCYYLMYSAVPVILGCIVGVVLGYVVETICVKFMLQSYMFNNCDYYIDYKMIGLICFFQIGLILAVTYFAAKKVLLRDGLLLLNGAVEVKGKTYFYEKMPLYKKTSIFIKILINNFVRDKYRVITTLIGISGCTALIVMALILNGSIQKSFNKQYGEYSRFNYIVFYDCDGEKIDGEIEAIIRQYTDNVSKCYYSYWMELQPNNEQNAMLIFVPDNVADYKKVYSLVSKETVTGTDPYSGIWVYYAYRNFFKNEALPDIKIESSTGKEMTLPITGFFDDYNVQGTISMDKANYEKYFGEKLKCNAFLLTMDSKEAVQLEKKLFGVPGYLKVMNYYEVNRKYFDIFSSITMIYAIVYFVMAVVLSFLVLLNKYNQFIDEKKKEIIILNINGYDSSFAWRYVISDTLLITVIGIVIGGAVGAFLGNRVIIGFDSPIMYILREFDIKACLLGGAGTFVLSMLMCFIALRRVDRFELSDISK